MLCKPSLATMFSIIYGTKLPHFHSFQNKWRAELGLNRKPMFRFPDLIAAMDEELLPATEENLQALVEEM